MNAFEGHFRGFFGVKAEKTRLGFVKIVVATILVDRPPRVFHFIPREVFIRLEYFLFKLGFIANKQRLGV